MINCTRVRTRIHANVRPSVAAMWRPVEGAMETTASHSLTAKVACNTNIRFQQLYKSKKGLNCLTEIHFSRLPVIWNFITCWRYYKKVDYNTDYTFCSPRMRLEDYSTFVVNSEKSGTKIKISQKINVIMFCWLSKR